MSLAVFHHMCGKREVLMPGEDRPNCKACDRLREQARHAAKMRFGVLSHD